MYSKRLRTSSISQRRMVKCYEIIQREWRKSLKQIQKFTKAVWIGQKWRQRTQTQKWQTRIGNWENPTRLEQQEIGSVERQWFNQRQYQEI